MPSSPSTSSGFTLSYPIITLHAISRDNAHLGPCVYCQLDESDPAAAPPPVVERENDGHYHPEDDVEEDTPMRELRIFVGEDDREWHLFLGSARGRSSSSPDLALGHSCRLRSSPVCD